MLERFSRQWYYHVRCNCQMHNTVTGERELFTSTLFMMNKALNVFTAELLCRSVER